jgi:hypothetical protein
MTSQTYKMRKYANSLRAANRRLTELSVTMRDDGFPLLASDVYKLASKAGTMGLAMSCAADHVRDKRGRRAIAKAARPVTA